MASRNNPRKVALLVLLLAVLAGVVVVRVVPALREGGRGSGGGRVGQAPRVGSYQVPSLGQTAERAGVERDSVRNLFTFGAPPTPTPDRRPTPTPLPTLPPRPTVPPRTPTPAPWGSLPPPPAFTPSYIGWLGPARLPVAVFRDGDEVVAVPQGGTVKGRFILKAVTPTSVTVGYVGYPDVVTTNVPLAR